MKHTSHCRIEAEVGLRAEPRNLGLDKKSKHNWKTKRDNEPKHFQHDSQDGLVLDC